MAITAEKDAAIVSLEVIRAAKSSSIWPRLASETARHFTI
jgi:hypothetical protein